MYEVQSLEQNTHDDLDFGNEQENKFRPPPLEQNIDKKTNVFTNLNDNENSESKKYNKNNFQSSGEKYKLPTSNYDPKIDNDD